jgi:hypothetical protein
LIDCAVDKFNCTFSVTTFVFFGDLELMPCIPKGRQGSLHMRLVRTNGNTSEDERTDDQRNHYNIADEGLGSVHVDLLSSGEQQREIGSE